MPVLYARVSSAPLRHPQAPILKTRGTNHACTNSAITSHGSPMTDLSDLNFSGHWAVLPPDQDPTETSEWMQALNAVIENEGRERATFLLRKLLDHARAQRVALPPVFSTPYCNTISLAGQPQFPGNLETEQRLIGLVRWNALATVVRANK